MKRFLLFTLLLLPLLATAQRLTNVIGGNVGDYSLNPQKRVSLTTTLLYPNPRTINNVLVRQDSVATLTDTNGNFGLTNLQWGIYSLNVQGVSGTLFKFIVGTNTVGAVPIGSLVTNAAALPPNPATNYYTQAQIDALVNAVLEQTTGTNAAKFSWVKPYFFGTPVPFGGPMIGVGPTASTYLQYGAIVDGNTNLGLYYGEDNQLYLTTNVYRLNKDINGDITSSPLITDAEASATYQAKGTYAEMNKVNSGGFTNTGDLSFANGLGRSGFDLDGPLLSFGDWVVSDSGYFGNSGYDLYANTVFASNLQGDGGGVTNLHAGYIVGAELWPIVNEALASKYILVTNSMPSTNIDLQAILDSFPKSNDRYHSGGGTLTLNGGIYYTGGADYSSSVGINNIKIVSANHFLSCIVFTNNSGLHTHGAGANIGYEQDGVFFASTVDSNYFLLHIENNNRTIIKNSGFALWTIATNNNGLGLELGQHLSAPSATALGGVWYDGADGAFGDVFDFTDNNLNGLAIGFLIDGNHPRMDNNFFEKCGNASTWPVTDALGFGGALYFGKSVANHFFSFSGKGNHWFSCGNAIVMPLLTAPNSLTEIRLIDSQFESGFERILVMTNAPVPLFLDGVTYALPTIVDFATNSSGYFTTNLTTYHPEFKMRVNGRHYGSWSFDSLSSTNFSGNGGGLTNIHALKGMTSAHASYAASPNPDGSSNVTMTITSIPLSVIDAAKSNLRTNMQEWPLITTTWNPQGFGTPLGESCAHPTAGTAYLMPVPVSYAAGKSNFVIRLTCINTNTVSSVTNIFDVRFRSYYQAGSSLETLTLVTNIAPVAPGGFWITNFYWTNVQTIPSGTFSYQVLFRFNSASVGDGLPYLPPGGISFF